MKGSKNMFEKENRIIVELDERSFVEKLFC